MSVRAELGRAARRVNQAIREEHPSASVPGTLRTLVAEGRVLLQSSRMPDLALRFGVRERALSPLLFSRQAFARDWKRRPSR